MSDSPTASNSNAAEEDDEADEKDLEGNSKFSWNFKRRLAKVLPGKRKKMVARQVKASQAQGPDTHDQVLVSRESTMTEPGISMRPEVRASVDDTIQGGTDVLEVWFAGCHSGKSQIRNFTFRLLIILLSQFIIYISYHILISTNPKTQTQTNFEFHFP